MRTQCNNVLWSPGWKVASSGGCCSLLGKLAPAVCFPSQRRWEHPGGSMFCSDRAGQELFWVTSRLISLVSPGARQLKGCFRFGVRTDLLAGVIYPCSKWVFLWGTSAYLCKARIRLHQIYSDHCLEHRYHRQCLITGTDNKCLLWIIPLLHQKQRRSTSLHYGYGFMGSAKLLFISFLRPIL